MRAEFTLQWVCGQTEALPQESSRTKQKLKRTKFSNEITATRGVTAVKGDLERVTVGIGGPECLESRYFGALYLLGAPRRAGVVN